MFGQWQVQIPESQECEEKRRNNNRRCYQVLQQQRYQRRYPNRTTPSCKDDGIVEKNFNNILAILSPKKRKCVSEEPEAVRSFGVHTIKDLTVPEPFACSMTFNKKLQKTKRQNDITQSTACFIIKDKISVENIVTDLWC